MLTFILWSILGIAICGTIGVALGNILSPIAIFIDELLELIPIPVFLSRLVLAIGTSWLVYAFCESRFWFGLIVGWWVLCFIWASGGDGIRG